MPFYAALFGPSGFSVGKPLPQAPPTDAVLPFIDIGRLAESGKRPRAGSDEGSGAIESGVLRVINPQLKVKLKILRRAAENDLPPEARLLSGYGTICRSPKNTA